MPIQLTITGDYSTDVISEIQSLAAALGGKPAEVTHTVQLSGVAENTNPVTREPQHIETEPTPEKPEKLTYKEQDAAVEEMVAGSFKDERYDLLTKGRQKKVDEAFETPKEEESSAPETEATTDVDKVIDGDALREIMGRLGKDKDGNANQDMLLKIRDLLVKAIPEGKETKVGNVPTDRMAQLYADIAALEE